MIILANIVFIIKIRIDEANPIKETIIVSAADPFEIFLFMTFYK